MVRILIADDHDVVRRGLRSLLEGQPGWVVVDEAVNGREAVKKAAHWKPDVVALDLSMPELNGLEATRQILKAAPGTEVVILTVHESEQVVREVLRAGARGYVLKSDAGRDLVAAVKALSQHKPFFTAKVAEMVLAGYLGQGASAGEEAAPRLPSGTLSVTPFAITSPSPSRPLSPPTRDSLAKYWPFLIQLCPPVGYTFTGGAWKIKERGGELLGSLWSPPESPLSRYRGRCQMGPCFSPVY